MIGVITFIGDDRIGRKAFDQGVRFCDVVALPRSEKEPNGVAERVCRGVDFGAQTTARAAQALGIRPPLAILAPAAC